MSQIVELTNRLDESNQCIEAMCLINDLIWQIEAMNLNNEAI